MLLGGGDMHRFPVRSARMDRGDLVACPAARQIYLTFPADSTFSEEDVSNYFRYRARCHCCVLFCLRCLLASSPIMDEMKSIDRDAPLVAIEQHVQAGARRAHPLPAEAHVRLRHLRLPGEREDRPEQEQPAFRVQRARARPAIQGEGQGPRQVQVCCISHPNNACCLSLDNFCF